MTYTYDSEGRLVEQRYDYTDDGVTDRGSPLFGDEDFVIKTTYDDDRVVREEGVYGPTSAPTTEDVYTFTYDASGLATQMATETTTDLGAGPVTSTLTIDFTYTGGLMTLATYRDGSASTIAERTVTYDSTGEAVSAVHDFGTGTLRDAYTWNSDGTLAEWQLDADGDGTADTMRTYSYDAGLPSGYMKDSQGSYASQPDDTYRISAVDGANRVTVDYDDGNDGTNDGVETAQLEEGACMTVTYPVAFPLVMVPIAKASSTARLSHCYP